MARWLGAAALALLVAACGGGGGGSDVVPNVTQAGGTVVSADGKVRLTVPPGAVSVPATLRIEKAEPDAETAADPSYLPNSSYRIVGDLGTLALPATWELTLDAPLQASEARVDIRRALSVGTPVPETGFSCNASDGKPIGYQWVAGSKCPTDCLRIHGLSPFIGDTYSMCVPGVFWVWDRTPPFCSNDPPHPNGLINNMAPPEGNSAVYLELLNLHGPGALCYRMSPPPPPVLVNNLHSAPLLTPCQVTANKLGCKLVKIGPGVLSVLNDTVRPSTAFLTILDQPGGSQQDPHVTLDVNGNGTLRYMIAGADDRRADFAELWEIHITGANPGGLVPITIARTKLATLSDVNPDPKIFTSSSPSHPHASVPFNATDPFNRFFFARVYDRAGNYRDSTIKRVTRVSPVVEVATFTANPATLPPPSGTTTLSWTVANALSVSIDQGVGDVTAQTVNGAGSRQVQVASTRTFTIIATGPNNTTDTRTAVVTVSPDTTAPTVTLSASPGTVNAPGSTTLTATVTDNVGVTQVEFFRGTTQIGTDTTPGDGFTQTVSFTSADQGNVSFTARAVDAANNNSTSAPIGVFVTVPMGADRFVSPAGLDSNPGTQAQPYLTLTRAFTQVGTAGTVWLANGTYTWAAEGMAGATNFDWKMRAFPVGRTLRAENPGLATVNFGFTFAGDATIVGVSFASVPNDGPGSAGGVLSVQSNATANASLQFRAVSFGSALSAGSAGGHEGVIFNQCSTCTVTLDTNGAPSFNYLTSGHQVSGSLFSNSPSGGPIVVNGGTFSAAGLAMHPDQCSFFRGGNNANASSFNNVVITLPAADINTVGVFCVPGNLTLTQTTISQQGTGRPRLFRVGGHLVLNNTTLTAPATTWQLVGMFNPGARLTATGSTFDGSQQAIGRHPFGTTDSTTRVSLTGSTIRNVVQGNAIDFTSGATVEITGSVLQAIQGSAISLTGGANASLTLRGTSISTSAQTQGTGVVVLEGGAGSVFDLGTTASAGGNTILGHSSTRPGLRVGVASGVTVQAVGNTWVASQQGASASGLYSGNVLVTSGSGQNYVVTSGALRLSSP